MLAKQTRLEIEEISICLESRVSVGIRRNDAGAVEVDSSEAILRLSSLRRSSIQS